MKEDCAKSGRESQVTQALNKTEEGLDLLNDLLDQLQSRLSKVLPSLTPPPAGLKEAKEESTGPIVVPLAAQIQSNNALLTKLITQTEYILREIEL